VLIFNWLYDVASDFQLPPRWHEELMDAVTGRDPDAAGAAMRKHVRHGLGEIHSRIASQITNPLPARVRRTKTPA
jgi:DNA-binding GntR family transcriptional regulator